MKHANVGATLTTLLALVTGLAQPAKTPASDSAIEVMRIDRRLDQLVPSGAKFERIVTGRQWVEGPVWNRIDNYLLFSDIPATAVKEFIFRQAHWLRA
jgi:gluconolactonase